MSSPLFLPLVAAGVLLGILMGLMAARRFAGGKQRALTEEMGILAREREELSRRVEDLRGQGDELRITEARLVTELYIVRQRHAAMETAAEADGRRHVELQAEVGAAREQLARVTAELEAERAAGPEKLALAAGTREALREDLAHRFKVLASEIFDEKSKKLAEVNSESLGHLLTPLRERLGEFQLRVEALKDDGIAGRSELKTQIEALRGMNDRLSADASNLARALKGSSKKQGDWGETLLIGILEDAGLRAGKEYRIQQRFATDEGRHVRPDIILDLPPGNKHLVIDSKVSLSSYADYCSCDDDKTRPDLIERHARSLRDHIDGLSKKSYQSLHQLQSLDFVMMFVPIEPAYLLALAHDGSLWQRAWSKDVLLVGPGTLYPVLRTIAHIWQQERRSRSVEDILHLGSALYDKVALFATTFEDVGKKITGVHAAYDKAHNQLAAGNGSVLSKVEKLREYGLRNARTIPAGLLGVEPEAGLLSCNSGHTEDSGAEAKAERAN